MSKGNDATLQAHYLRLYKKADDILRGPDNPCQIQMVEGLATCHMSRKAGNARGWASPELCCSGCEHHSKEVGCTVESLGCKLGWCFSSESSIEGMSPKDHPTFLKIAEVRSEAWKLGVPMRFRGSFQQNFPSSPK